MLAFARETGDVVAANVEAARLYGYTVEEILEQSIDDLVQPGFLHYTRAFRSGVHWSGVWEQRRSDGGSFEADAAMTFDAGADNALILIANVVSEEGAPAVLRAAKGSASLLGRTK